MTPNSKGQTTHTLAKSLRRLASLLLAGPNVLVDDLHSILDLKSIRSEPTSASQNNIRGPSSIFEGLQTLSKVSKADLVNFISLNKIPIQFRDRDASRDILDKLIRYFGEHPEAHTILKKRAEEIPSSSPLRKALDFLLGD